MEPQFLDHNDNWDNKVFHKMQQQQVSHYNDTHISDDTNKNKNKNNNI